MEENKREGRSGGMMKEVVGCVQAVLGKKKFLVKFEDLEEERDELYFAFVSMFETGGIP